MQKLWFDHPAECWNEALPIGNGSLGAMLYGGMGLETIAVNADTFWAGCPHDKLKGINSAWLEPAREAIRRENFSAAEQLVHKHMQGEEVDGYQPVGTLRLDYQLPDGGQYQSRTLELAQGIHQTRFTARGREYCTEAFVSFEHDVIAVRVTCDRPACFRVGMDGHYVKEREQLPDSLILRGQAPEVSNQLAYYYPERVLHVQGERGVWYELAAAVRCDGILRQECESIWIEDAAEVFLCLSAVTSYDGMCRAPGRKVRGRALDQARTGLEAGYDTLRRAHVKWFSGHMERLELELTSEPEQEALPVDKRLQRVQKGEEDPGFVALYLQYGRYLLLSSSAKGMPANLQGIWNGQEKARWNSNYTLNINLPMNYWLAETGNLEFCHKPLFDFLDKSRENGRAAARAYFNCGGFFLAHNSDLWGSANPVRGYPRCIAWTTGAAWLCRHLWEHYLFGGDRMMLSEHLPVMEEAVRFTLDYLKPDGEGTLSYYPSSSPENEYLWNGEKIAVTRDSAMELSIVRELLEIYLAALKVLERSGESMAAEAEQALAGLRPLAAGRDGRLLEWGREAEEAEPGHRHLSHLYGVYPAWTLERDPELYAAARRSLDFRMEHGGGHTGWSAAWAVCLYARFGEGARALEFLKKLWCNSTLSNLFDTCNDVFQIDGNLGAPAGILEMLVQSHRGRIDLLPALPKCWKDGRVRGIRLRGGGELDMTWKDGQLLDYRVRGVHVLPVYYQGERLQGEKLR